MIGGKTRSCLSCNLNYCFFHGNFLLERMTDKTNWLFKFEYLIDNILKSDLSELFGQGEQLNSEPIFSKAL